MPATVCLITTTHLAANPRLVKEAAALLDAGYRTVALYYPHIERLHANDEDVLRSLPGLEVVPMIGRGGGLPDQVRQAAYRAEFALWRRVVERAGPSALAPYAMIPRYRAFRRAAARVGADLYVAHNLGALPVAAYAAAATRAKLGFDAEDFHRGEYADPAAPRAALTRWIEAAFIPRCDYVTAASDGIADAYVRALDVPRPTTVLNVFPLADRGRPLGSDEREREKPDGAVSLYWFSQVIGPDRGLEDVVRALPALGDRVQLSLRGRWAGGYEDELGELAEGLGVRGRVRHLPVAPPGEMVVRAACHDVGLALETGETENRRLCVTNKIFTYLLAGVPAVATDTEGQRGVAGGAGEAVALYAPGDVDGLVAAVERVLASDGPRQTAERLAASRYNWEAEQETFLRVVRETLAPPAGPPPRPATSDPARPPARSPLPPSPAS